MPHALYIVFVFALGACVGSFLNVVVWRLPRGESLVSPPSHCPHCNKPIKWYDNIPVAGWLALGGRCRFCKEPISIRYPIIEAVTGLLFVFYYCMFFLAGVGPCMYRGGDEPMLFYYVPMSIETQWPMYAIDMVMVSGLLAVSLIDAESFQIPIEIPWWIAAVALAEHAIWDGAGSPGALNASAPAAALAAGGGLGVLISFVLWRIGVLPQSFAEGGPLLDVEKAALVDEIEQARKQGQDEPAPPKEYSRAEIRHEMRKEMLFLIPPMASGLAWLALTWRVPAAGRFWQAAVADQWVSGLLGSVLGLLVGGFVVWLVRILGSIAFGREAMGMGDVHLMAGVGAVIGAGAVVVAFFLAPFVGLLVWAILFVVRGAGRELPFGPYLSLGAAASLLCYCPIAERYGPPLLEMLALIARPLSGG